MVRSRKRARLRASLFFRFRPLMIDTWQNNKNPINQSPKDRSALEAY